MTSAEWDRRYAGKELVWTAEPNRFVVEQLAELPAGRALDLACGEGRNAVWLAERGWRVTGVDFSPVALEKGRRLAEHRGVEVEWVVSDVLDYRAPASGFELVLVAYLQLPAGPRGRALRAAADAVAPGGTLLVIAHDVVNLDGGVGGPQDPDVLYTPEEVAADLAGLRVVAAHRVRRPVGEEVAIDTLVRATRRCEPGPVA